MRPSIQIYGQFGDFWSNACVSRGIASAFVEHGWQTTIHDRNGQYDGIWFNNYTCGMDDAGVGLYVGYAIRAMELLANHAVKVGAFITESAVVPSDWAMCANACDLVMVPSNWVAKSYILGGVNPAKVVVAPHGLHPCFMQPPSCPPLGGTRFLHVAGARDFIERKGTPQLIEAWKELPSGAGQLVIRTPPSPKLQAQVEDLGLQHRVLFDFHDTPMHPEAMRNYLLTGDWAAVIQPSRAEAFGLVPVEARACGLPVIMTVCSGHAMHVQPNDVIVASGPHAPLAVNGIPNGTAPTVTTAAIVEAVKGFLRNRNRYAKVAMQRAADGFAHRWRWSTILKEAIERLAPPRKRRL